MEHDLVALKVGVHAVQARRVVCEERIEIMSMKIRIGTKSNMRKRTRGV